MSAESVFILSAITSAREPASEDVGMGYAVLDDYIEETKGALNYDG